MIKVVLIQRLCPHYRIPIFVELARKVDLVLYYGAGRTEGAFQNAKEIIGFKAKELFTLGFDVNFGDREYYISWFPALIRHLIKDNPEVVITEGATNIVNNLFLIIFCKIRRIPLVIWDAGRDIRNKEGILRRVINPGLRLFYKQAKALIVYGEMARQYFMTLGFTADKIFVAQNTLDVSAIDTKVKLYSEEILGKERERLKLKGKKVILYCGAIEKRRKIENLISVYKDLKVSLADLALLIVGDGNYRDFLEKQVEDKKLQDVHFLGRRIDDVELYYLLCDMLVLPGWSSLAINHAMACGKPVITVSSGGPEYEHVNHEKTGFIIAKGNISELYDAILKILKTESLRSCMGEEGRKKIHKFSIKSEIVNCILNAIFFVLKKRN